MQKLTRMQRVQLLSLTAASGSIPNLETALASTGCLLSGALPPLRWPMGCCLMLDAAAAGQLEVCQWLWQQHGCPLHAAVEAAAASGQRAICEWGLAAGCPWASIFAYKAAEQVHVGLMEWLLHKGTLMPTGEIAFSLLEAVAAGCDLLCLQRFYQEWVGAHPDQLEELDLHEWCKWSILAAAAGSPTPDWQAKVEWLEARGFEQFEDACKKAAGCPDALDRLRWLRGRGYPLQLGSAIPAAERGNLEVLRYLLEEGLTPGIWCSHRAAAKVQLAALQLLHDHGCPLSMDVVGAAAAEGHLHVVVWLVEEVLGPAGVQLENGVFSSAAKSCKIALLSWLRGQGCPWDASVYAGATEAGCAEALEWLTEQGCPMQEDGTPYVKAARNGDLATLRCLRRLGCPWGPPGLVFARCIRDVCELPVLGFLLESGCPADWDVVAAAVEEIVQQMYQTGTQKAEERARVLLQWLQENSEGRVPATHST
ncbi:hypothetical protein Agub_g6845 [Astrephomene gubernaculifera]|uniref:Ankyrin repeat domain-containing protein n=1 Tax=Astrephomene gubernaculifera TaxID=47775 RepID=A0AAD3DP43_9CHLO|nr:hypothetical protein Agub_g6845 [Astrephomene gubernaculifera]